MIGLAGLLGGGSLLVLMVFLFRGSLNLVVLRWGEAASLWLDACLSMAFFIQHSGMIRRPFRKWASNFVKPHYQSATYAIASGIVLLALLVFWQESSQTLFVAQGIFRWALRAGFFVAIAGFYWGTRALGPLDPLGIRAILQHLRGTKPPPPLPFTIRGPYRWVRHPLYLLCLLMIWSCPDLTADRLLFNILWTAWTVIGTVLEERDLVADFGEDYRKYRRRVPMLVPWRGRVERFSTD